MLAEECRETGSRHSETLLPVIGGLLGKAGLAPSDVEAVAVTSGPGSFTGLRVGLSTAKGLALAAGIPLAGFSTLKVLAEALAQESGAAPGTMVCALLDAGRGQLYRGLYAVARPSASPWRTEEQGEESIRSPEKALAGLAAGAVAGGDGAARHADALRSSMPAGILLIDRMPCLAPLLAVRAERLLRSESLPAGALKPNYVRPPDALAKRR